jgi:hypothetical protein
MADATHKVETFETEPITKVEVRITYRDGRTHDIQMSEEPEAKLEASFSVRRDYKREFRGEEGTAADECRMLPTGVSVLELKVTYTQSPEHPVMKSVDETWHPAVAADHV